MFPAMLLWYALLHALSLVSAVPATRSDSVNAHAHVPLESNSARWTTTRAPVQHESIRVPLRVSSAVSVRAAHAVPTARSSGQPSLNDGLYPMRHEAAPRFQHHSNARLHRLVSFGALLPYFPTAPPRRA